MTSHLHFDLVGGMAGDMTVAALLDAGAPFDELRGRLVESGLPTTAVRAEREWRGGMAGTRFFVAPETDPPHRRWRDIRALLENARLTERARGLSLDIFGRLAAAEAHVHGCDVEEVHFHEVGAMDSIVDIVAASVALDLLGAGSFSCGPVPFCEGSVEVAHGHLPLPVPATTHLLHGFELVPIAGRLETVTPTGAAILAALIPGGRAERPAVRLRASGAGLGTAELPGRPNVLRVLLGERVEATGSAPSPPGRHAVVIEANIDDMDPRLYGEVSRQLFAAGALDVAMAPLQMKKQRPGTLLSVLSRPELEGVLSGIVLRETTSLGVRSHDVRRTELERRTETVETRFGPVRVKLGLLGDECINVAPEYDDCERLAREQDVPLKDVLASAVAAASHHWTTT